MNALARPRALSRVRLATLAAAAVGFRASACGPHSDFPLRIASDLAISASFQEPQTRIVFVKEPALPPAASVDGSPLPAGLDPAQARDEIEAVDLAECWVPGYHGTGFARITFNPAGSVDLVEVKSAVEGAKADSACLSHKFSALHVTPYNGAPFVVTANIIVG